MTKENRLVVDAVDLDSLRIECVRCHTSTVFPLSSSLVRIAQECPGCREPFWESGTSEAVKQSVQLLADQIRDFRNGRHKRFSLKFEVAVPGSDQA